MNKFKILGGIILVLQSMIPLGIGIALFVLKKTILDIPFNMYPYFIGVGAFIFLASCLIMRFIICNNNDQKNNGNTYDFLSDFEDENETLHEELERKAAFYGKIVKDEIKKQTIQQLYVKTGFFLERTTRPKNQQEAANWLGLDILTMKQQSSSENLSIMDSKLKISYDNHKALRTETSLYDYERIENAKNFLIVSLFMDNYKEKIRYLTVEQLVNIIDTNSVRYKRQLTLDFNHPIVRRINTVICALEERQIHLRSNEEKHNNEKRI